MRPNVTEPHLVRPDDAQSHVARSHVMRADHSGACDWRADDEPDIKGPDDVWPDNVRPDHLRPDHVRPNLARPNYMRPDNVRTHHGQPDDDPDVWPSHVGCSEHEPHHMRPNNMWPDNVRSDNMRPDHVRPNNMRPDNVRAHLVRTHHGRPHHVRPHHMRPHHVRSHHGQPNDDPDVWSPHVGCSEHEPHHMRPNNVWPDNVRSDNMRPDNVRPDIVRPDNVRPNYVWPNNMRPHNVRAHHVRTHHVRTHHGQPDDEPDVWPSHVGCSEHVSHIVCPDNDANYRISNVDIADAEPDHAGTDHGGTNHLRADHTGTDHGGTDDLRPDNTEPNDRVPRDGEPHNGPHFGSPDERGALDQPNDGESDSGSHDGKPHNGQPDADAHNGQPDHGEPDPVSGHDDPHRESHDGIAIGSSDVRRTWDPLRYPERRVPVQGHVYRCCHLAPARVRPAGDERLHVGRHDGHGIRAARGRGRVEQPDNAQGFGTVPAAAHNVRGHFDGGHEAGVHDSLYMERQLYDLGHACGSVYRRRELPRSACLGHQPARRDEFVRPRPGDWHDQNLLVGVQPVPCLHGRISATYRVRAAAGSPRPSSRCRHPRRQPRGGLRVHVQRDLLGDPAERLPPRRDRSRRPERHQCAHPDRVGDGVVGRSEQLAGVARACWPRDSRHVQRGEPCLGEQRSRVLVARAPPEPDAPCRFGGQRRAAAPRGAPRCWPIVPARGSRDGRARRGQHLRARLVYRVGLSRGGVHRGQPGLGSAL